MWDDVPEHIWVEILVKVPVKSLIVASSVCKVWRSLIRSPFFISVHLSNAENKLLLWYRCRETNFCNDESELLLWRNEINFCTILPKTGCINSSPKLRCPFSTIMSNNNIVGTCDGLVCVCVALMPVIIWNPSIRNHVILPLHPVNLHKFEQHEFGFGVASNVYKVVMLRYSDDDGFGVIPPQAYVFSLGTGNWRTLSGLELPNIVIDGIKTSIFFNGFVHWISYTKRSINNRKHIMEVFRPYDADQIRRHTILRFHVGDEVFSEIMLPKKLKWGTGLLWFNVVVMGELSLGGITHEIDPMGIMTFDVWMMKDYGVKESWTKLYTIGPIIKIFEVFYFLGNGEAILYIDDSDHLTTYNVKTKEITHADNGSFYANGYKESLVLLGGYPNFK